MTEEGENTMKLIIARHLIQMCIRDRVGGIHQPFPGTFPVENAHHGGPVGFHLIEGSLQALSLIHI